MYLDQEIRHHASRCNQSLRFFTSLNRLRLAKRLPMWSLEEYDYSSKLLARMRRAKALAAKAKAATKLSV